jgi:hypothetical protein
LALGPVLGASPDLRGGCFHLWLTEQDRPESIQITLRSGAAWASRVASSMAMWRYSQPTPRLRIQLDLGKLEGRTNVGVQ